MKRIYAVSFRNRFLAIPIIAITLISILYMASNYIMSRHSKLFNQLNQSHLPYINELSHLTVLLINNHFEFSDLLLSSNSVDDEERIYIKGRKILNNIYDIEEKLARSLLHFEHLIIDDKNISLLLENSFNQYRSSLIGALELSTVDSAIAFKLLIATEKQLMDLNQYFLALSHYYQAQLTKNSNAIDSTLFDNARITTLTIVLIAFMLFIAIYGAGHINAYFYTLNKALNHLIQDRTDINLPNINNPETEQLNAALLKFKDKIIENRIQHNQLEEHKNKLERKVIKRTHQLQQSQSNLTTAQQQLLDNEKMRMLGEMVASSAHEMNTPLSVGVTAASHLSQSIRPINSAIAENKLTKAMLEQFIDTVAQGSKMILSNLERAADLVHSFRDIAVDQTSDLRRNFNLKHYVEEIILSLQPKFKNTSHRIELVCDENINMDSYPGALAQVITNLTVNSLIHGFEAAENGVISIKITALGEGITLLYKDNGSGIPEQNVSLLFEPFFTTKRGKGGSGLGMHIIKKLLIERLQGSINYHPLPSRTITGVRFLIKFPQNLPNPPPIS